MLGINCIKPSAPVLDFAALKNSLSCLITDKTSDLSTFWSNAKSLLVGNNSLCRGVPFSVDFFATVSEPFINQRREVYDKAYIFLALIGP